MWAIERDAAQSKKGTFKTAISEQAASDVDSKIASYKGVFHQRRPFSDEVINANEGD
jgi:hypothetical protein